MACIKLLLLLLVICNAEAKSANILIISYDVVASFHSHFMESLTVYLSEYYNVTFLVNQLSTIKNNRSSMNFGAEHLRDKSRPTVFDLQTKPDRAFFVAAGYCQSAV